MKRFALSSAVAATVAFLGTSMASATMSTDIVTVAGPGGDLNTWQTFPGSLNSSSSTRPYWDQASVDGTDANIGNYLDGGFNTSITGPVGASPAITPGWWGGTGSVTSNFDTNEHFNQVGGAPITVTMALKATSLTGTIGWYNADNTSQKTVMWSNAVAGDTYTFTAPPTNWGFYLTTSQGTFYMDAALSSKDTTNTHFALFQDNSVPGTVTYYVGIEDTGLTTNNIEGIGDFQDFILTFQTTAGGSSTPPTPEPASLSLLAIGASGLLLRRRK